MTVIYAVRVMRTSSTSTGVPLLQPAGLRVQQQQLLHARPESVASMSLLVRRRFLRFPGGCYVEGDTLEHSFYWKRSVGAAAERPGHWNLWGYWSTDGAPATPCNWTPCIRACLGRSSWPWRHCTYSSWSSDPRQY